MNQELDMSTVKQSPIQNKMQNSQKQNLSNKCFQIISSNLGAMTGTSKKVSPTMTKLKVSRNALEMIRKKSISPENIKVKSGLKLNQQEMPSNFRLQNQKPKEKAVVI